MMLHARAHECADSLLRLTASLKSFLVRSWPHALCVVPLRKAPACSMILSSFSLHTHFEISDLQGHTCLFCTQWPPADRKNGSR